MKEPRLIVKKPNLPEEPKRPKQYKKDYTISCNDDAFYLMEKIRHSIDEIDLDSICIFNEDGYFFLNYKTKENTVDPDYKEREEEYNEEYKYYLKDLKIYQEKLQAYEQEHEKYLKLYKEWLAWKEQQDLQDKKVLLEQLKKELGE